MSKKEKSKIKSKDGDDYLNATEGIFSAKNFLRNLRTSMGEDPDSLFPEDADEIFKINELVDLRLIKNKTYIYIDNKRFVQCFNLLFNVDPSTSRITPNIKNMDEASRILGSSYSSWFMKISPKEAFMAHCSNIQAFFENNLNTDLLHSDIAFPLLKKLVQLNYKPAEAVFTGEVVKRYNEGTWESRRFLKLEGYLKYLNREERRALKKEKHLRKSRDPRSPRQYYRDLSKNYYKPILKLPFVRLKSICEFDDVEMRFKLIKREIPLIKLLDSEKILLFNDPIHEKVWIWHGTNTSTQMKYYAKQLASNLGEEYRMIFDAIAIDEGFEPPEFKKLINLEEDLYFKEALKKLGSSESFSIEKALLLLEKLKKETNVGNQMTSMRDFEINFKLVEKEIIKVKTIMKEESVNELTIHRQYLQEVFHPDLLEISKYDGNPAFKNDILTIFEIGGILIESVGNVLRFFKLQE